MRYMLLVLAVVAMLVGGATVSSGALHMHSYLYIVASDTLYDVENSSHIGTVSYILTAQAQIYGGNWCWAESLIYDSSWAIVDCASADSAVYPYKDSKQNTYYFDGNIHTRVEVRAQSMFCYCVAEASVWW